MFIPDLNFSSSRIPDLREYDLREYDLRENDVLPCEQKIFEEIGTEVKYFNPKKIVLKLSEVMVGSGIRIRDQKTYSGSRIQGSKSHRIPDQDPQHCLQQLDFDIGNM